jgi:hypothetical protein
MRGPLVSICNTNRDERGRHANVKKIFENPWEALTHAGSFILDW